MIPKRDKGNESKNDIAECMNILSKSRVSSLNRTMKNRLRWYNAVCEVQNLSGRQPWHSDPAQTAAAAPETELCRAHILKGANYIQENILKGANKNKNNLQKRANYDMLNLRESLGGIT